MRMSEDLKGSRLTELVQENARLRRVIEILHDSVCPADSERFPEHGPEVCRVFWMDGMEQDRYWYRAVCEALAVNPNRDVPEWNSELNRVFRVGTSYRVTH